MSHRIQRGYIEKYWKWVIGDQDYTRDAADSPEERCCRSLSVSWMSVCSLESLSQTSGNIALDREADIDGDAEGETSG